MYQYNSNYIFPFLIFLIKPEYFILILWLCLLKWIRVYAGLIGPPNPSKPPTHHINMVGYILKLYSDLLHPYFAALWIAMEVLHWGFTWRRDVSSGHCPVISFFSLSSSPSLVTFKSHAMKNENFYFALLNMLQFIEWSDRLYEESCQGCKIFELFNEDKMNLFSVKNIS